MLKFVFAISLLVFSLTIASAGEVRVSAAISLSEALREIGFAYEKQTGNHMTLNFGASSLLARQIEEGAPADIFFSADEEKIDQLQKEQLVDVASRRDVLSNVLVVIVPAESKEKLHSVEDLLNIKGNIAIAQPDSVPAGIYAKQYLSAKGLWEKLQHRLVPTENVRAALAAVESEGADAGFVYKTDVRTATWVKIAFEITGKDSPKIVYPVAALQNSKNPALTAKALSFLLSPAALDVYRKYGFIVLLKSPIH